MSAGDQAKGQYVQQAADADAGRVRDCRKTLTGSPAADKVAIPSGSRGFRIKPNTITARWSIDQDPDAAIRALSATEESPTSRGNPTVADEWSDWRLFDVGAEKIHLIGSGAGSVDIEFF